MHFSGRVFGRGFFRRAGGRAAAAAGATTTSCNLVTCEERRRGEVVNWSGTRRSAKDALTIVPDSDKELLRLVDREVRSRKTRNYADGILRPLGACLSPNGAGLIAEEESESGSETVVVRGAMVSCEKLTGVQISKDRRTVTVGAGCTVAEVLDELAKEKLTLSNFSSVTDQTIAGWTQVGAHGTGVFDSTVDEMVVALDIVVPGGAPAPAATGPGRPGSSGPRGGGGPQLLTNVTEASHPSDFHLLKCGLGLFGFVTSLTLQVVPSFSLQESIQVLTRGQVITGHRERLRAHRNVRYHWIPYTEKVVVTVCDEVKTPSVSASRGGDEEDASGNKARRDGSPADEEVDQEEREEADGCTTTSAEVEDESSFAGEREHKLRTGGALDVRNVADINRREADFWERLIRKKGQGGALVRTADSTEILGFQCGGSQHVLETCFRVDEETDSDLRYVLELLDKVERHEIPAPSPIEQRWTKASRSYLSPAHSSRTESALPGTRSADGGPGRGEKMTGDIFTWVGIIMYRVGDELRAAEKEKVEAGAPPEQMKPETEVDPVAEMFTYYAGQHLALSLKFGGIVHWGKIPRHWEKELYPLAKACVAKRFGAELLEMVARKRLEYDPAGVLGPAPWEL
mmetsp:Transcript_10018/g.24740  ORF Transcript_10018/g.24740 Transcript_10018/m.24740 type:complete len:630 (+) Transcript_10018:580-2469(+)